MVVQALRPASDSFPRTYMYSIMHAVLFDLPYRLRILSTLVRSLSAGVSVGFVGAGRMNQVFV